eukprot:187132-Pyramimonas_sp.AAC.1
MTGRRGRRRRADADGRGARKGRPLFQSYPCWPAGGRGARQARERNAEVRTTNDFSTPNAHSVQPSELG